jgi:tetratricopeptide (TPR) repeat protein
VGSKTSKGRSKNSQVRQAASGLRGAFPLFAAAVLACVLMPLSSCASAAASAEEYYSIGMAYFELAGAETDPAKRTEKFSEAEKWFNRARSVNKTMTASEYNLGRIAFETGDFEKALKHFERVLEKDSENIMALKAAAYCRIKLKDFDKAEEIYARVLAMVPESVDDGYNYALVCYAMENYEKAEAILLRYSVTLRENSGALLLLARSQVKLDKIEAADTYAQLIAAGNTDTKVRYEYAQLLEKGGYYAKALEEYQSMLTTIASDQKDPSKAFVRFTIARLLLVHDRENSEGAASLNTAVSEGFADIDALEALLADERISDAGREAVRQGIGQIKKETQTVQAETEPEINAAVETTDAQTETDQ